MKELFSSKKIQMTVAVSAILVLVLAYFAKKDNSRKKVISEKMALKVKEVDMMLRKKDSPRKEENLDLRNLIVLLSQKNKEIISLSIAEREKIPEFAPLEFKEELLKTQAILKENAGFPLPEGIGFKRYIGGVIPEAEDIPILTRQLYIAKAMIELLIKAKVKRVEQIKWHAVLKDKQTYTGYLFELKFVAATDNLINLLVDLQQAKDFVIVHSLGIKRLYNLELTVAMNLKVIDFKE